MNLVLRGQSLERNFEGWNSLSILDRDCGVVSAGRLADKRHRNKHYPKKKRYRKSIATDCCYCGTSGTAVSTYIGPNGTL